MEFNDLLRLNDVAPEDTAIMLHQPASRAQRRYLMAMVEENRALFEAYQDNHPSNESSTLRKRKYAASFVLDEEGEGHFVGLYSVKVAGHRSAAQLDSEPLRAAIMRRFRGLSYVELAQAKGKDGRLIFKLELLDAMSDMRGRLVVGRPSGRSYMRLAENAKIPALTLEREPRFVPPAPDWQAFILTADDMRNLPKSWAARLREWRGIYLIVDELDGGRYVGSAYGQENLFGRWLAHVAGNEGQTVELARRATSTFRFSILQRVDPDMSSTEVIGIEQGWKQRLHTARFGLNQN